ncbi:MAG: DegV family protein [Chloroflexi bacterium]|nr:DegV family protein [Chloroflexota bacterium]
MIAIITDSTADLPAERFKAQSIDVVPLYVVWGEDELLDGRDITAKQFYERLETDPVQPMTSQPTPADFAAVLQQAREAGAEAAVILTISTQLSGTYSSALQAAKRMDFPVHVHDSRSTSMGLGWQVLTAAKVRDEGGDCKAILKAIEDLRSRMVVMLYVDTLEYLHKGGRIGGARRLIGTALNIKPMLYVNNETGEVEAGPSTRTRSRAVDGIIKRFIEQLDPNKPAHIGITDGNSDPSEIEHITERIKAAFPVVDIVRSLTSPVIGVHTGPRAFALCGYSDR